MRSEPIRLTYEIDLQPGERLTLPESLISSVGAGHWILTIRPRPTAIAPTPMRSHSAFLSSYAPEDEGLYDDLPR